jgi:tetratricopeptide (TPR) repeat protein
MKAVAIDPLWLVPSTNLVYLNLELGRIDEIWEILERLRPFHQDSAQFHEMEGTANSNIGQLADAHRAFSRAYELSPDTPSIASQHAFNLVALQDFETAIDVFPPQFPMIENFLTGDWDSVLPQVREMIDDGQNVGFLLFGYTIGASYIGDYEGMVSLYDAHIKSPDWLVSQQNEGLMIIFAPAMRALNRDADAQLLLDAYHEYLLAEDARGIKDSSQDRQWSAYYALTGDDDAALERLQAALDAGLLTPFWQYATEYHELEQDPGFVAIKAANLAAVNAQRADLGWAPVAEVGIFYQPGSD